MVLTLSLFSVLIILFLAIGYSLSAPRYRGPVSDHFNGKTFVNPGNAKAQNLGGVLKWMFTRERSAWPKNNSPIQSDVPGLVQSGIRVTYVNHSTFLIQVDGLNILTDPIWAERASPFSWLGPRRKRQPGIPFETLPKIDVILLSHNHYDHLDLATLKAIAKYHRPKIFTALGIRAYLEQHGIDKVTEMDWWDELAMDVSMQVQAIPAQHFSARGMFDRNATLWCGFMIKSRMGNIYFAGDTGYNENLFKEIGNRCSPIIVSLIPIGAYKPIWFMAPVHCSPEEAVTIHKEVRSRTSIATHFGTFALGDESPEEAVTELRAALRKENISDKDFQILHEGESRTF